MNIRDKAHELWNEHYPDLWPYNIMLINIECIDKVFYVEFMMVDENRQKTKNRVIGLETYTKNELTFGPGQAHNSVLVELWNHKSGVDRITIGAVREKHDTKVGSWPDEVVHNITTSVSLRNVSMYSNNKLHHNYKPARITFHITTLFLTTIEFFKNGKLCIPPEKQFPSRLVIPIHTTEIAMIKHNNTKVYLHRDCLTRLYSRVPKTRWGQMDGIITYYTKNFSAPEQIYHWDGNIIPPEILDMIDYPLSDVDMFTIMLCC